MQGDNSRPVPVTLTSSNCELVAGASWKWITKFARAHSVPMWKVDGRRFIPAASFLAALELAAETAEPVTRADEVARLKAEITAKLRGTR